MLICLDSHYHADCGDRFAEALAEAGDVSDTGDVIVDLSGVALLSSAALRALRTAHDALSVRGGSLSAAGGGDLVVGVLRFAPFMTHYDSVDEAAAAIAARGKE